MNIDKKKIKIEIFDDQYSLISDEKEENLLFAAKLIDTHMREIAEKSSLKDEKKIAVLAALRVASKLVNVEYSLQDYERKQKELTNIIDKKGLSSSF